MAATNGTNSLPEASAFTRFSDVPSAIDIPVQDFDESVELDLLELSDDPSELCTLFENESAARNYWMTVALAYAKQGKPDHAIEMLIRGANAMQALNPREKLSIVALLCWLYLFKCRAAPRTAPEGVHPDEAKTKEHYLALATSSCNEASRLNPMFPPLLLAKGVVCLMNASLAGTKQSSGARKTDLLKQAIQAFDGALRASNGKNVMAIMGKARGNYALANYSEALSAYQDVLRKMPTMTDPDPRIGIGCCFWQLGFKEDASVAWKRSLELNENSKIANILLGLYHLDSSGRVPINSQDFVHLYKKAMMVYTQKAFKLDKDLPITCATFSSFFLSKKNYGHVESLSHKAIQYTDVNAIASDGWYLLARKEHSTGDLEKASMFYRRADEARGGADRGYIPAKFGAAQLSVVKNDLGEAKLRLEKMMQQQNAPKNYEAMVLLGTIYAEEFFANQLSSVPEDKSEEAKKAIMLLDGARAAWKDTKKNLSPDSNVLLNLARLYESAHPDKALQCLLQAEQLEIDSVPGANYPEGLEGDELRAALRKFVPPQLLNNIGCFYSLSEKHAQASAMFEAALDSCMRISETQDATDTDALVTTTSFNLGRSYESRELDDKAVEVYEGLLARHDDYVDARTRLAYIKLRKSPTSDGPDKVTDLYKDSRNDLEVRALYGWFLGRQPTRKKPSDIQQDQELRHYKHTLQHFDKHDRYALVGMGNLYLMTAREMRRESEQDKQKRSSMYSRAVEFFDKALQLDPKNAYAAEGVAIALIEDKKDYKNGLAILFKVRETVQDSHVFVNLGHIYTELRQFSKAIESYEAALSKQGKSTDVAILSCLGRVWLTRARVEKDLEAYKKSLEYAQKALEGSPESSHSKFNLAFVQIQLASMIHLLSETQRSLLQLEDAADGLESAITALDEIARGPQPPYPKQDIEQRVNMARNTQRKQLEKAIASQREYEERNKEKLAAAVEKRQAELQRREAERQVMIQKNQERQDKLRKEREELAAKDRLIIEKRREEENSIKAAEYETDSETGERVKKKKAPTRSQGEARKPRPRKKKAVDDEDSEGEAQPKKRRRLATKKEQPGKFKSAERIVDSDEEGDEDALERAERAMEHESSPLSDVDDFDRDVDGDKSGDRMDIDGDAGEDEGEAIHRRQRRGRGKVLDSDEEDEGEEEDRGKSGKESEAGPGDTSMDNADEDED